MYDGRRGLAFLVLCTASFIAVVDTTIVSIALPSIRAELGFTSGGRFLQGIGAAAFVPASLSLLTATFTDQHERNRAIGIYGAMAALGFVVGMVGGGVVTELWGWRWVFFVAVPVALLALLASRTAVAESHDRHAPRRLDVTGALAVTAGLVLVIYAMSTLAEGDRSGPAAMAGVVGLALLVAFVVVERRHSTPLVPPAVVARKAVLVPNAAIAVQSMIGIAWLYLLTLYFQEVLGHGPLVSGLLFAPMTVAAVIAAPVGGRLVSRLGARATGTWGLALVGTGLVVMVAAMSPQGPLTVLVLGMCVGEAGFMLSNVSLTVAGTSGVESERGGLAAGLLNTSIQLGSGWGLGVVAVVVAVVLGSRGPEHTHSYTEALRWGLVACAFFCACALVIVSRGLSPAALPPRRS